MSVDALDDVTPEELLRYIGRATDGSDVTTEEVGAFLSAGHSAKTQKRMLAWLAKTMKRAALLVSAGEPEAEVVVATAHRGRVTGYSMACLGCGLVAPRLASSKRFAQLAAIGHLREDHESVGRIDVRC